MGDGRQCQDFRQRQALVLTGPFHFWEFAKGLFWHIFANKLHTNSFWTGSPPLTGLCSFNLSFQWMYTLLTSVQACQYEPHKKRGHLLINAYTDVQNFFWGKKSSHGWFWPHKTSSGCAPNDLVSWLWHTPSGMFPFLGTLWPKSKDSFPCVHTVGI